jgi:translocator protein
MSAALSSSSSAAAAPSSNGGATENRSFNKFNAINLIGYVANAVVVFGVGSLGWFDRPSNGELSDKYQTIITPSGYAFSIWGPIFILQFLWVLWQMLPSQRNSPGVTSVGYWYLGVCLMQVGWTLAFSWEIMWLSLVFMYGILFCLVGMHLPLQQYDKIWKGYFLWQFPFSLHLGWIIAASLVNTSVVGVAYGASVTAQMGVAVASLALVVVAALAFLSQYPVDLAPPLVLVWAMGAVYAELQDPILKITSTFSEAQISGIQTGSLAVLSTVVGLVLLKAVFVLCVQRPRARSARPVSTTPAEATKSPLTKDPSSDAEEGRVATTGLEKTGSSTSSDDP